MTKEKTSSFVNQFLVGCDPELMVISNGDYVRVSGLTDGKLGIDHNGRVLEIRPSPRKGTYSLIKDMQGVILGKSTQGLRQYKWQAGVVVKVNNMTKMQTLGGHIHFDLNPNSKVQPDRVLALDILTETLERLDILPREGCVSRRTHSEYGKFKDTRVKDGQRPRFEYRTMPSWLFHPNVAYTALTLGKLACADPDSVLTKLRPKTAEFSDLQSWAAGFRMDVNARRWLEKLNSHKKLLHDPEANVHEVWGGKLGF